MDKKYSFCLYCWYEIMGRIIQLEEDRVNGDKLNGLCGHFLGSRRVEVKV